MTNAYSKLCPNCRKVTFNRLRTGRCTIASTYLDLLASAETCKLCKLALHALQSNRNFLPPTTPEDEAQRFRFPCVRMWIVPEADCPDNFWLPQDGALLRRSQVVVKYSESVCGRLSIHNADPAHPVLAAVTITKDVDLSQVSVSIGLTFAKRCLDICDALHTDHCGQPVSSASYRPPPRLYNIAEKRLEAFTNDSLHVPYTTLSYIWGGAVPLQIHTLGEGAPLDQRYIDANITERNLGSRSKPGGLDLETHPFSPKAYQRAVDITRRLGINYVWIDSVCIVQSGDLGADQRAHFGSFQNGIGGIYENAVVTLAAVGESANFDMYGPRRVYHPRDVDAVYLTDGKIFVTPLTGILQESLMHGTEKGESASSMDAAVVMPNTVGNIRWDSRGWPFQERMLSCRLLYFTEAQQYFECRQVFAERGDTGPTSSFRAKLRTTGSSREMMELWPAIVADYCLRGLSFWSDRLNGIAAVATQMSMRARENGWVNPALTWCGTAGVFEESLARDMFWVLNGAQTVEGDYLGRAVSGVGKWWGKMSTPPPSWSWGIWKGNTTFPRPLHSADGPCGQLSVGEFEIVKEEPVDKEKDVFRTKLVVKRPRLVRGLLLAQRTGEEKQKLNYDFGPSGAPKDISSLRATSAKESVPVGWAHVDPGMAYIGEQVVGLVVSENRPSKDQFVSWNVVLLGRMEGIDRVGEERPLWAREGETVVKVREGEFVRVGLGEVWMGEVEVGEEIEIV